MILRLKQSTPDSTSISYLFHILLKHSITIKLGNRSIAMPNVPSIHSLIKDLDSDELREVIVELCKLSPKNKQFLHLFLQSTETVNLGEIVEGVKKKIHTHFYGRSRFPKIDLAQARKVVDEYSKVLREYPAEVAELKLYFVETGTELTNRYGDIDDRFYTSLGSMFEKFCTDIKKHPNYYDRFAQRIADLQFACKNIGWGYGDYISDLSTELENTFGDTDNSGQVGPDHVVADVFITL